jgi:hypothetical protein
MDQSITHADDLRPSDRRILFLVFGGILIGCLADKLDEMYEREAKDFVRFKIGPFFPFAMAIAFRT